MEWLSGDAPGWLSVLTALLTFGGGGYVGGRSVAIARARLDDRRELLSLLLSYRFRVSEDWARPLLLQINDLARRLPHVDRVLIYRVLEEKRSNIQQIAEGDEIVAWFEEPYPLEEVNPVTRYLEWSINPSIIGRANRFWLKIRAWRSGPFRSRTALWNSQEKLRASEEIIRQSRLDTESA